MKRNMSDSFRALLTACVVIHASLSLGRAQTNILFNGGFELGSAGWDVSGQSRVFRPSSGAVEGTNVMSVSGVVAQDVLTVAGRDYVLQFAYSAGPPQVTWGGTTILGFTNLYTLGNTWKGVYIYVRAESDVTRLSFQSPPAAGIDDVRVGWLQEPLSILDQPQSLTVYEGGTASFTVSAQGSPPLSFQWMFNGAPILQATGQGLTLTRVRAIQAGNYSVLVSNIAGPLLSTPAVLNVQPSSGTPVIFMQPESRALPAGYGTSLTVGAIGSPPLAYQWRLNDTNLPGATNSAVVFDSVQTANAGTYTLLVSNAVGTTLSLPAALSVTNAVGGGLVIVSNTTPIYNSDGVTRLAGMSNYVQLYAGSSPTVLRPIGPRKFFRTNTFAGFFVASAVQIPDVAANASLYVQLRAWEANWGASYEQARAVGGKFGFSQISLTTAKSASPTITLMPGFSLRAGLPFFFTGRLAIGDPLPDGTPQMLLYGQPGFRYLIEKQSPPNNWLPFLVVTNVTGTVVFPRAEPASDAVEFYRSRMLD